MPTPYSEIENIKKLMRQIVVGDPNVNALATIGAETIARYQEEVDERIDSVLDPIYETPLVQVKLRNGQTGYPGSIPWVANRMTAAQVVLSEYSEIDPNSSGNAKRMYDEAEIELYGLVKDKTGSARLPGQRPRSRIPFVPPSVYPRADQEPPKSLT